MKKFNRTHGTPAERLAIANRFRAYRAKNGLSQNELAKLIDLCDRSAISDIERGQHLPHHSTLRRFVELERREGKGIGHA